MIQKPFNNYFGGKAGNGTYQFIINQIPKVEMFIDAMCGNLGITSNLKLPSITVLNDYDSCITDKLSQYSSDNIIVKNCSYWDLIDNYDNDGHNKIFYFDPPYLKSSRKSSTDIYKFEWSDEDHKKFLSRAMIVKSNCMISHYPCSLYDEALKNWRKLTFKSMTRQGLITEAIYMNYPQPKILQDYRYIGKDFTDRQRIKRKMLRLQSKISMLTMDERMLLKQWLSDHS